MHPAARGSRSLETDEIARQVLRDVSLTKLVLFQAPFEVGPVIDHVEHAVPFKTDGKFARITASFGEERKPLWLDQVRGRCAPAGNSRRARKRPCAIRLLMPAGEGGETAGDFLVAFFGGVLVAQGCAGGGVAESVHEFGEGCAGLGGEDGAGVAEVVPT
ncbi:hypothetical protein NP095_06765 [Aeromicrobium duanguangcaii]|uniref:Uncharacterized protein n=1 Tax=Aeromicrobium duanguangcaii TaxID=2968086 RepID=A0ABY5KL75_9ACTN|nr:hypothetical protein [Aeromicrobium duanguangcaii]MCD9153109.1 hypothetical protein [Aeromicrobium duanguangcaii]UUI69790.1 hypothetical protein NP095_06765 [Aeromicrobium duanguangcaii]